MLNVSSGININSVIWITTLDPSEMGPTNRVHDDVQHYLASIGLPFCAIEPRSRTEFLTALAGIEKRASEGLRPIIHLDAHGSPEKGLRIAGSGDDVSWSELVAHLRPINIATQNNLCVVSAVCSGLYAIKPVSIEQLAPFFVLIAPENEITFGFVEQRTARFYEALFNGLDVAEAYTQHLAPEFKLFHCEERLLDALSKYVRDYCLGSSHDQRVEDLLTRSVAKGLPNTRNNRRIARSVAKNKIKPTQELIDRFANSFLLGKKIDVKIEDVVALARKARENLNER
jgi:hypothetical protein